MKVAIFAGEIPSTTFIEHLIRGVGAQPGVEVYIFGKQKKKIQYISPNIKVFPSPDGAMNIVLYLVKSIIKLVFSQPLTLLKIPAILKSRKVQGTKQKIEVLARVMPILLNPPDVFHLQWVRSIDNYFWVKSILNKKLIVSFRGAQLNWAPLSDPALAATYSSLFPQVDGYHGVSKAIVKEAMPYNIDPAKAVVINPAVDVKLTEMPLVQHQHVIPQLLSVGRFHWKKAYYYSLDALKLLDDEGIDFRYTLIANGGEGEEILYQIHDLGLQDKVEIIPGLPHDQVLQLMHEADFCLLPSVEEGIANVVLESMALGTPVITTNCGGMSEVVEDGMNSFIVPVRDTASFANAIKTAINMPSQRNYEMKEKARQTIINHHLISQQVESMHKFYQKVMEVNHE